jgi:hypothetical protein
VMSRKTVSTIAGAAFLMTFGENGETLGICGHCTINK